MNRVRQCDESEGIKTQCGLLCVTNFPANTGYAWDFIESVYARIADNLVLKGVRTLVAYPEMVEKPVSLNGSAAIPIRLDVRAGNEAVRRLIKEENVRAVYLTDRPPRSLTNAWLRACGVRHIIVHDHSSGERTRPRGLKRLAKWAAARCPYIVADQVLTVSEYVRLRQINVNLIPKGRVTRVYNGLDIPALTTESGVRLRRMFDLDPESLVIACACRAAAEKGVEYLLRAFETVSVSTNGPKPVLIYAGDGPQMNRLRQVQHSLKASRKIIFAGYRRDVSLILEGADVCVVPSIWQDAFPLAVLEVMAYGKAVVATRVGGIPEMVDDGVSGLLVAPADEAGLARAITLLLENRSLRRDLGAAAREKVAKKFTFSEQIAALTEFVEKGLGLRC